MAIGLLVLLALAGPSLAMEGGGMLTCPSCSSVHAPTMFSICLAVLAIVVVFSLTVLGRATTYAAKHSPFVVPSGLFKPPRTT